MGLKKPKLQNELADPTDRQGFSNFGSALHEAKTSRHAARCSIRRQISSRPWEDRCPVGTLEEVLVEELAATLGWLGRLLIADSAQRDRGTHSLGFPSVDRLLNLSCESNILRDIDRTLS